MSSLLQSSDSTTNDFTPVKPERWARRKEKKSKVKRKEGRRCTEALGRRVCSVRQNNQGFGMLSVFELRIKNGKSSSVGERSIMII